MNTLPPERGLDIDAAGDTEVVGTKLRAIAQPLDAVGLFLRCSTDRSKVAGYDNLSICLRATAVMFAAPVTLLALRRTRLFHRALSS